MRPDAEKLVEAWAKIDPVLVAVNAQRVATALPDEFALTFLRVHEIDGANLTAEGSDVGTAYLQWDAYAYRGHEARPDWQTASLLARTLIDRFEVAAGFEFEGAHLIGFGRPTGPRRGLEASRRARFVVDVTVALRPA